MKIFGHKWIESKKFYKVDNIDDIKKTPSNSIILIDKLKESIEIAIYCNKNSMIMLL